MQAKNAMADCPEGLLFIKMTGPSDAMAASADAFNTLVGSATKS